MTMGKSYGRLRHIPKKYDRRTKIYMHGERRMGLEQKLSQCVQLYTDADVILEVMSLCIAWL